jgi:hypothetical protein
VRREPVLQQIRVQRPTTPRVVKVLPDAAPATSLRAVESAPDSSLHTPELSVSHILSKASGTVLI